MLAEGAWQKIFKVKPEVFTREERQAWLEQMSGVALGSDAFFPYGFAAGSKIAKFEDGAITNEEAPD